MARTGKYERMEYVADFFIVFTIGYICSMSVALLLVKLFFPFFTKEELARKRRLALSK
jgi:hypothetical protein